MTRTFVAAPSAVPSARFLHHLDPLAKVAATLPVIAVVVISRDVLTPVTALTLAILLLLIGSQLDSRATATLLGGAPLAVAAMSISFGIWVDDARLPASPTVWTIGEHAFTTQMWLVGLATASRMIALVTLALVVGLTTTGVDLVRALIQHLRLPYRIGYTALAASRLVPRFGHELDVIRAAHRARGMASGRGPAAIARRWVGYLVPLLHGALRHADHVALAMDARAFGYAQSRTERHRMHWRRRDTVVVLCGVLSAVALLAVALR